MTYNSSVGMKTFVNATAGGVTVGARSLPASTFLSMGKPSNFDYLNGVSQYFNGYIGAWKIYSRALTVEEITQLKEVQEKRLQLIEQFGIIELRIQEFSLQKEYLIVELKKIRQEETTIGETLQKKYGDGSINLEKGEFISA